MSPGKRRCGWVTDDPLYLAYHDEEWGVPVHNDRAKGLSARLQEEIHNRLGLRIEVAAAEPGSLPRYELKAKRFKRDKSAAN